MEELNFKKVGMNVRLARVKLGMTVEELARRTGMSVTTISHLENGKGNTRMLSLSKIASVLGVDVEELINE